MENASSFHRNGADEFSIERTSGTPRHVLITGSARGIGRAIAEGFAKLGDRLTLVDLLETELQTTANALGASPRAVDVSDHAAVQRLLVEAVSECGEVDVLINVAGVNSRFSVEDTVEAEWDRVFDVNVKGVYNFCYGVAGGMRTRGTGSIINVGSMFAHQAWPNRAAYCASKAAVQQFTRCLALEVAPYGVAVHGISPGIISSEMTKGSLAREDFRQSFMPRVSTGIVGDATEHLAGLAVFLASPAAAYMTGEIVSVHGGYY